MLAPLTARSGARSPPMASSAMLRLPVTAMIQRQGGWSAALCRVRRRNLPAVIVTAGCADMMRTLQFAAVRALQRLGRLQGMVRPPHVATRLGDFFLWNSHQSFFLEESVDLGGRLPR